MTFQPDIPEGIGFAQFSMTHLVFLGLLILIDIYIVRCYLRSNSQQQTHMRWTIGGLIFALEFLRQAYLALTGQYNPSVMPFHLCGLGIFIVAFDTIKPNNTTRELLYSLTIWGAFAALLFPDWTYYPAMNIWTWQSFLIHALLIVYPLMLLISKQFVPNWHRLWRSIIFVAICVPFVYWLNGLFGTNFWFLNTAAGGSPLTALQNMFGPYYPLSLIVCLLILWFIMYLPWAIVAHKRPHR
jgi:hypothetical integral membrane protein (TIGR02206 family)